MPARRDVLLQVPGATPTCRGNARLHSQERGQGAAHGALPLLRHIHVPEQHCCRSEEPSSRLHPSAQESSLTPIRAPYPHLVLLL